MDWVPPEALPIAAVQASPPDPKVLIAIALLIALVVAVADLAELLEKHWR